MFVGSAMRRPGRPTRSALWCVVALVAALAGTGAWAQPALAAGHTPKPQPASAKRAHPAPTDSTPTDPTPAGDARLAPPARAGLAPLSSRAPVNATAEGRTSSHAALCESAQRTALADPVAPVLSGAFPDPSVVDHQESMLVLTLTGPDNCSPEIDGLGYTVTLPAGAVVGATTPGAGCDATIAAAPGGTTIAVTNAVIPVNTLSCALQVPVTSTASGAYPVTATSALSGVTAAGFGATLTVTAAAPTISAAFSPTAISPGGTATLTTTMARTATDDSASGLGYTVTLPAGLTRSGSVSVPESCGTTSTTGVANFTVLGVTLTAASSCTATVAVTASVAGDYALNGAISAIAGGAVWAQEGACNPHLSAITALARAQSCPTLGVAADLTPVLTAAFETSSIPDQSSTAIVLTLTRADASVRATGLGYRVTMPTGLVATSSGWSWSCDTVSVAVEPATITVTGLIMPSTVGTCTTRIYVSAAAAGTYPVDNTSVDQLAGGVTKGLTTQTLTVTARAPYLRAAFSPGTVAAFSNSVLQLNLLRTDTSPTPVTGLGYVVTLPAGMSVGTGSRTNTCGGTVTAAAGASTITVVGVTMTGADGCHLWVPVTASVVATYSLQNGNVTTTGVTNQIDYDCDTLMVARHVNAAVEFPSSCLPHVVVEKAAQAITFDQPGSVLVTAGTTQLTATASSGLGITFSASPPQVCSTNGSSVLHVLAGGTCSVTASQGGNGSYLAAAPVQQSIVVVAPPPAPGAVTAVAGDLSIIVSWTMPDATGVTGYRATAAPGGATCVTEARNCVLSGTAGTTYTVTVVAMGAGGVSAAAGPSNEVTILGPVAPHAPGVVTAVAGDSSITVSWSMPDATGVTGYRATASPGPAFCETDGARTCVLGGVAGTTYTVTVVALGAGGVSEATGPSNEVTPPAPVPPAAAPPSDETLTTTDGMITTAAPGQEITFVGTGFAPFSTVVITLYSAPIVLGTVVTDSVGSFSKLITVPPGLALGEHSIAAIGVDPDGSARSMVLSLLVGDLPTTGAALGGLLLMGTAGMATGAGMLTLTSPRRRRTTFP